MQQAWKSHERYSEMGFGAPSRRPPVAAVSPALGWVGGLRCLSFASLAPHFSFLGLGFFICVMRIMVPVPLTVILISHTQAKLSEVPG